MLHNFIRIHQGYLDEFDELAEDDNVDEEQEEELNAVNNAAVPDEQLYAWRDGIAQEMWDDYQIELARRGGGR